MRHSALRPRSIGWCDDGADDAGRAIVLSCSGQEPSRRGAHASAKVSRSLSARPVPARAARYPRSETFMTRKDVTRVSWRARTKPWSSPALTAGVSPADGETPAVKAGLDHGFVLARHETRVTSFRVINVSDRGYRAALAGTGLADNERETFADA